MGIVLGIRYRFVAESHHSSSNTKMKAQLFAGWSIEYIMYVYSIYNIDNLRHSVYVHILQYESPFLVTSLLYLMLSSKITPWFRLRFQSRLWRRNDSSLQQQIDSHQIQPFLSNKNPIGSAATCVDYSCYLWIQEISNKTHWTDPYSWVSNSSGVRW